MTQTTDKPRTDMDFFISLQREVGEMLPRLLDNYNWHRLVSVMAFYSSLIEKNSAIQQGSIKISVRNIRQELLDISATAFVMVLSLENLRRRREAHAALWQETLNLYKAKNQDYGNSYKRFGSAGVVIRLRDKLLRIRQLVDFNAAVKAESLRDTLVDTINYGILAVLCIDQGM